MQFSRLALRFAWFAVACGLVFTAEHCATSHSAEPVLAAALGPNDPWTTADVVEPADLAREIAEKRSLSPKVLYVGFRTLFAGGHIAGAAFHGTASTEAGMADIKKWADTLPRSTNLVIYCGCCPFDKCPNVRPAFVRLHEMGFMHVRVLALPENFNADWFEKGFPTEKGM